MSKEFEDGAMEVIPAAEVKQAMDGIKSDMAELKKKWADDVAATGLELEKRADDFVQAAKAVEDLTVRLEKAERAAAQNNFVSSFGTGAGELKDALESFQAGFHAFDGDRDAVEHTPGTKPQIKHLIEGVFQEDDMAEEGMDVQFHAPRHTAIRRLQKAADRVYQVDAMMRAQMDANALNDYNRAGGIKSLKAWRKFEAVAGQFQKAAAELIDTSTEVANWIPTQYSANLYEMVKLGLPELNLFPEVTMNAATMELPLDMNDHEAMRVTEVTTATNADPYADTDFMNPGALSSNKITLSAEKVRSRYWLSQEAEEDTIVAMIPLLNGKLVRGIGEALADAIINGQPTNIDTGGTHFSKANPLAAAGTDSRDLWDGLRRFTAQYTGSPAVRVDNSNGKPTVVGMRGLRAAMGEYGANPSDLAYLFGVFGYIKLLDDSNVLTIDKFGPNATVRTGSLAQVDGVDVVVSRRIAENMNASGVIDGVTTNRTQALAVHTMAAILGNRRRITLGTQSHLASDTTELVAFWRGDFQPVYPVASVPAFAELYNVVGA